jgi:hypothetical protein
MGQTNDPIFSKSSYVFAYCLCTLRFACRPSYQELMNLTKKTRMGWRERGERDDEREIIKHLDIMLHRRKYYILPERESKGWYSYHSKKKKIKKKKLVFIGGGRPFYHICGKWISPPRGWLVATLIDRRGLASQPCW